MMQKEARSKSKKKVKYLLGIDVGFGLVKLVSNYSKEVIVFPSTVIKGARISSKMFELSTIDQDNMIVTTSEGTHFVGEQAMNIPSSGSKRTQVRDRANDIPSRVLFKTGIAMGLPHEDGEYEVFVVTGLPNDDYDLSIRDRLEEFLSQDFEIEFHLSESRSITKKIKIVGCEILRQPEGTVTYNQFQFDRNKFLKPSATAKNSIGEIDFGHFTTDYALFREGIIIEDDTVNGSSVGVTEVYNLLRKRLVRKFDEMGFDYRATDKDLDTAIQTGYVHYMGQDMDVRAEVEECARKVASVIAKSVLDAWGNETNRLELIIVSGGGVNVFSKYLLEEFQARKKQTFTAVDAPQYSNALGFYMYSIILHVDEMNTNELFDYYIDPVFNNQEVV